MWCWFLLLLTQAKHIIWRSTSNNDTEVSSCPNSLESEKVPWSLHGIRGKRASEEKKANGHHQSVLENRSATYRMGKGHGYSYKKLGKNCSPKDFRPITITRTAYTFELIQGVPQGFVLSPTLFAIYLAGIKKVLSSGIRIGMFADYIVLWSSGTANLIWN
ncbi:hypothetical protein TNCV_130021 [Trichonephila clavipes]|nr:hypothetical protein TNCV_130021 [Trichonephila clavipes]